MLVSRFFAASSRRSLSMTAFNKFLATLVHVIHGYVGGRHQNVNNQLFLEETNEQIVILNNITYIKCIYNKNGE